MIETLRKWYDEPEKYGFVRSDDPNANDGLNMAVLNEMLQYNSYNQIFLSYGQKAELVMEIYKKRLNNEDMTDEGKAELEKKINNIDRYCLVSVNSRGSVLNGLMGAMVKDIRKHPKYKGEDAYPAEKQVDQKIISLGERAKTVKFV
jgi:hypothetical protein